ncbi:MAG TPA: hypothetical protein VIT85_05500 [Solirubrobacterales bacterium]
MRMIERRLIGIYLEDHYAGSTGGVELARRLRASNRDTEWTEDLERICVEVEEDRDSLRDVMEALGVRRNLPKAYGAWAFEKVGRLKLNGRLTGYSPLSRIVELEMLMIGVTGKQGLWDALRRADRPELEDFDLEALGKRAEAQRKVVKKIHRAAAERAFAGEAG